MASSAADGSDRYKPRRFSLLAVATKRALFENRSHPVAPTWCTWWPHKHYFTMDVPTHASHAHRWMSSRPSLSAMTNEEELIIHRGTHSRSHTRFTLWRVWCCLNWSIMYLRLTLQGHQHGKNQAAPYRLINHDWIICSAPCPIWTSSLSQSFIFRMRSWS